MKKIIYFIMMIAIMPAVFADVIAPPIHIVVSIGFTVIIGVLLVNYIVNFALSLPTAKILSGTKISRIAKGLLIITPLMLAAEIGFYAVAKPSYMRGSYPSFWLLSFLFIFLCYFITGEKMWEMNGKKAAAIATIMGILTNPAYFVYFTAKVF